MQKIQDELIKKIYRYNLSKFSLITLLDLINAADASGKVQVYYKDLVQLVNCSTAQFYNVLKELESVGLIKREKNKQYKNEMEITIVGNDFEQNGYQKYVDTNKKFFTERHYKNMSAVEISTYLYAFFRISKQRFNAREGYDKNKLPRFNDSYKSIAKQIGVTKRTIKKYMDNLKSSGFICIGEKIAMNKKKYDIITLNKTGKLEPFTVLVAEKGKQEEIKAKPLHLHYRHFIKNLCRRHGKIADNYNLDNAAMLCHQYRKKAEQQNKNIYQVLTNAIINLKDNIMDSKTLHYIIRQLIAIDYNDGIVIF